MRTTKHKKVYHWSRSRSLASPIKLKKSPSIESLEGVGISVSIHPGAWRRIARPLGAHLYQVTRLDGKPLQFALHSSTLARESMTWAVQQGLVAKSQAFTVAVYDEEGEEAGSYTYSTFAKAMVEADNDESLISLTTAYRPQGELLTRLQTYFPKGKYTAQNITQMANIEALNMFVAKKYPQLDGVWWNEKLDVYGLSAPRGVILPHVFPRVVFKFLAESEYPARAHADEDY